MAISDALRTAWPLPNDTFITDGLPELLTRLSLVPYAMEVDPPAADEA